MNHSLELAWREEEGGVGRHTRRCLVESQTGWRVRGVLVVIRGGSCTSAAEDEERAQATCKRKSKEVEIYAQTEGTFSKT